MSVNQAFLDRSSVIDAANGGPATMAN